MDVSVNRAQIKILNLLSGPVRFAQKLQTRFHTGVLPEAIDLYLLSQCLPAIYLNQIVQYGRQLYPVQRIVRLLSPLGVLNALGFVHFNIVIIGNCINSIHHLRLQ